MPERCTEIALSHHFPGKRISAYFRQEQRYVYRTQRKSITTVIAMEEADGEYSNDYPMNGRSYRGSSYARGRMNARRDSMGRYSRDGYSGAVDDMVSQLKDLMEDAPNESIKTEMRRLVKKIEIM